MLGFGIGMTVALVAAGSALLIVLAIGFGHALGRGKPKLFRKLDTGDYLLYHLTVKDWQPKDGRGTALILVSRVGTKGVSYVRLPMEQLRSYDNQSLNPTDVASILFGNGAGFVPAEIVEKNGGHFLRIQRSPLDPPLASLSVGTSASVPVSPAPPECASAAERPASPNGNGETEPVPPPAEVGGS